LRHTAAHDPAPKPGEYKTGEYKTGGPMNLAGKTLFITGASRGIGLAIALRAARDGAHIVVAAKTAEANPKLPGTIYSAAEEIDAAGGKALPVQCDIRDEASVQAAVAQAAEHFGGIDILVNNASAISLTPTSATPMKRFDLMFGVNVRGTFACTQACLPHLRASAQAGRAPQVLTMSPPLNMDARWFAPHVAYTMAKYGMSECTLGHAAEFRRFGIAVNSLWPRTAIATAALQMIPGMDLSQCRRPEIMADAAWAILTRPAMHDTGRFFVDEDVLKAEGAIDLDAYSVVPGTLNFIPDLFLD
jgi:citronellol/citronellal dehydrogenase